MPKKKPSTKTKKKPVPKEDSTIRVRHVDDLQIYFYDKDAIYICHPNGINLYHTWYLPRDGVYYDHIRYFRMALMELKHPTLTHINHLAYRHGLVIQGKEKLPDFGDRVVKIVDVKPKESK